MLRKQEVNNTMKQIMILIILAISISGCTTSYGGVKYSRLTPRGRKHYKGLDKLVEQHCECIKRCSTLVASLDYCNKNFCNDILPK